MEKKIVYNYCPSNDMVDIKYGDECIGYGNTPDVDITSILKSLAQELGIEYEEKKRSRKYFE